MKQIMLIATCCCLLTRSRSQLPVTTLQFGFKGGLNHTTINGVETNGSKTGFTGTSAYMGFYGIIPVGKATQLQTEALFSWINDWNFIEVPVHIRQTLSKRWSAFLGPKLDIAADRFDKKDGNTSGLLGVSAETGIQFSLTKKIFFESRYSIGITRQFRDAGFDINEGRRNNFRFGVGLQF